MIKVPGIPAFLVFALLFSSEVRGQTEVFAADRPGLSDAPDLIKPKSWQISSGFDISKYNHTGNYQISENTLKYGINRYFEARLDFGYQYDPSTRKSGATVPSLGLKTVLCNQKGIVPKIAWIIEYYPHSFSASTAASGLATEFCFSHSFTNGSSVYYNAGANWQNVSGKASVNSLIGYSDAVNSRFNWFTEFYFFKSASQDPNYVTDIGLTYLLNKRLLLDISGGSDISRLKGNFYYSGGLTYNF